MEYSIRPARKSDASAMYYISVHAHTQSYYGQLIPSESMPDFLDHYRVSTHKRQRFISSINRKIDNTRWVLLVAEGKTKVVGYTLAYVEKNNTLTLKGLFVDPKYHHQGIGSRLFEAKLEKAGQGRNIQLVVITSNKVAKAMYEKYGFKVTSVSAKTFFGAEQDIMERVSLDWQTDELPWFKDLAYYNGSIDVWRHLESIKGDDLKFMFVLLGKADPANRVHERILLETKSID